MWKADYRLRPLSTIRQAGISDITIIGNKFIDKIREHVGEGVNYVWRRSPEGLQPALQLLEWKRKLSAIDLVFR